MVGSKSFNSWLARWDLRGPILLGLCLRVLWVIICRNEPTSDQFIYHQSTIAILEGRGFVTLDGSAQAYWPVGYPALLVPFYWLIGPTPQAASVANLFFGLLTAVGAAWLIRDLWGKRASQIGSWVLALHPTLILYTTCIASENAYFAGSIWFALAALRSGRAQSPWRWVLLAAVIFALTIHVRGTLLLLAPLVPLAMLMRGRSWLQIALRTATVGLLAAILLVPWSVRNQREFGKFTPLSLNGAANLWMGNHPGSSGGYEPLPEKALALSFVEREELLGSDAKSFILANPGTYLRLCAMRTVDTLKIDTIAVVWNEKALHKLGASSLLTPLKALGSLVHLVLLGLALYFAVRFFHRPSLGEEVRSKHGYWSGSYWFNSLVWLMSAAPFVLIVSGNRYHLPLIPFTICFVAAGIDWSLSRLDEAAEAESFGYT